MRGLCAIAKRDANVGPSVAINQYGLFASELRVRQGSRRMKPREPLEFVDPPAVVPGGIVSGNAPERRPYKARIERVVPSACASGPTRPAAT